MSLRANSDFVTPQPYIPVVTYANQGKLPGPKHFATVADFQAAVIVEQGNVTLGLGIWADGSPITTSEFGVVRTWNAGASHARKVRIGQYSSTLSSDTNVVVNASGAPSSGFGSNGDLAYDPAAGLVYLKASGAWGTGASVAVDAVAQAAAATKQAALVSGTNVKTINGVSILGAGDLVVAGSGSAAATPISQSHVLPLDSVAGKIMTGVILDVATPFTLGTGAVEGGSLIFAIEGTGSGTAQFPADWVLTGTIPNALGQQTICTAGYTAFGGGTVLVNATPGKLMDRTAMSLTGAALSNADRTHVTLTWSEPYDPANLAPASAFTLSSHTVTAHAAGSDSTHTVLTLGEAATYQQTLNLGYTLPGSGASMRDLAGNITPSFGPYAVTNNVAMPVPGAPTLTPGTNTQTAVNLTAAPGAGSSAITSYTTRYKLHSASTYTAGPTVTYAGASTPISITGLTAGQSYDVEVTPVNASGSGTATVLTSSTAAAPTGYSYLRFAITANRGNFGQIGMTELQFFTGSTQLVATSATADYSPFASNTGPDKLIDNDLTTGYLADGVAFPAAIVLGFGSPVSPTSYRFATRDDSRRDPVRWHVDGSTSGSGPWTVLDDRTAADQTVPTSATTYTAAFAIP